jgi:hypothetical protein
MQPSAELRDFMVRYWEAFSTADISLLEAHISAEIGVLGIGTDPSEWYEDADVRRVVKEQLQAAGAVSVRSGEVRAFEEGSVGWLADRPTFTVPGGASFTVRFTAVAHREDGEWKLVQAHTSVGVPNEQLIGQDLPTRATPGVHDA